MNNRIRELIEQAHERKPVIVLDPETCQPTHKIGNGGVPMYHSELNPEKFAELIVRECMDVAVNRNTDNEAGYVSVCREHAAKQIAEHFGVE